MPVNEADLIRVGNILTRKDGDIFGQFTLNSCSITSCRTLYLYYDGRMLAFLKRFVLSFIFIFYSLVCGGFVELRGGLGCRNVC